MDIELPKGAVSKQQIQELYGISSSTLAVLLNKRYYITLKEVGYIKKCRLLSPKQFEVFISLYGAP